MSKNKFEESMSSDDHFQPHLEGVGDVSKDEVGKIEDVVASFVKSGFNSAMLDGTSSDFKRELATRLIAANLGWDVVWHLEEFPDLDRLRLAEQLLDAGQGEVVASSLDKFQGLDHVRLAEQLLDAGQGEVVAKNLDKFQGLDQSIVYKLLASERGCWEVVRNLDKFQDLDHVRLAEQLLDAGQGEVVASNLDKFQGVDHVRIAERLLDKGFIWEFARALRKFHGLNQSIADKLLDDGLGDAVADNLDKFQGVDHVRLAEQLLGAGRGAALLRNLDSFQGVDHVRIVERLLGDQEGDLVVRNLNKFHGLNQSIANKLLDAGHGTKVADNLDRFQGLDHVQLAERLLAEELYWSVASNLDKFQGLNQSIADKLLANERSFQVARNLDKFQGLDESVIDKLLASGWGEQIVDNLDKLQGIDHVRLAKKLLLAKKDAIVARFINNFEGLDREVALKLIEAKRSSVVASHPDKFDGIDHHEIASALIAAGQYMELAVNLDKFRALDGEIARALIRNQQYLWDVVEHLDAFQKLDNDVSLELIEKLLKNQMVFLIGKVVDRLHPVVDPDHVTAIYFNQSVPKAIRVAPETYAPNVLSEHQRARLTHALSPSEYRAAKDLNGNLASSPEPLKEGYTSLLEILERAGGESVSVSGKMKAFGDFFGPEVTMRFANRPELSRHDAFVSHSEIMSFLRSQAQKQALDQHLELETESPIEQELASSFSKVLLEVAMDDSTYEVGTAHHQFNQVVSSLSVSNLKQLLEEAESLRLPGLSERLAMLRDGRFNPLESWKGLKDAYEISRLFRKRDLIESLRSPHLPDAVKTYASTLLQHPGISLDALTQFLAKPEAFLDADGRYVDEQIQRAMSPARMLDVERLGLTAVELRDALVDGTLDRLQILPPMEVSYRLALDGSNLHDGERLRIGFDVGIGRHKQGVKGEAQAPKKLFSELNTWSKRYGWSQNDCAAWLRGERSLPEDADLESLARILHDQSYGIPEPEGAEVRVRIGRKDDPSMIVAGNDTASCMPFGDGKSNVYSWGPAFAQLVVERKNEAGKWRTMAQSVLTLDFDAGGPASAAINVLRSGKGLDKLVSPEAFATPPLLVCDNIEPAPNDIAAGRAKLIEAAYVQFMRMYLEKHAKTLRVDPSQVIVGKEDYLDENRWSFQQVNNTYVPLAPLSYTDNSGAKAYRIETGLQIEAPAPREGITEVTATDIMPMTFLEAKNYADNPDLVFGLYDRQHKIVGANIAAEIHGDPKLSFISRDAKGVPVGYMINFVDRTTDVPEIFIDDMAVDRSRNMLASKHAIRLIDTFLDRYATHYRESGKLFPPIYAQMRETTSYRLLTRQAETLSKKFNLKIDIVEEGDTILSGETFKLVRIFVGSDLENLAASKKAFEGRQRRDKQGEDEEDV